MIWRTWAKSQALFNLAICSNYSITNYVKFPVFHFFERLNKEELKMLNVNYSGLLHKLRSYGISGQIIDLSSFLSNLQLRVVLDGKFSRKYPVNAGVPQEPILGPTHFLLILMTFLMMFLTFCGSRIGGL